MKNIGYLAISSDVIHPTLLEAILFARASCDYLVCGVVGDSILESHDSEALYSETQRKSIIESLKQVDRVVIQNSRGPVPILTDLQKEFPNVDLILFHSSSHDSILGSDFLTMNGGKIIKIPSDDSFTLTGAAKQYTRRNQVDIPPVSLPFSFVQAWGGTTSLQSLECHTLRYVTHADKLACSVTDPLYANVVKGHHTVYFSDRDILTWNEEGKLLSDRNTRETIVADNLDQIKRFFAFYSEHGKRDFSSLSLSDLGDLYDELLSLVMENGSFFAYSREDTMKTLKEVALEHLTNTPNAEEVLQDLITPTGDDIFYRELYDKISIVKEGDFSDSVMEEFALRHPWRFINTYSWDSILAFLRNEFLELNLEELEQELVSREQKKRDLAKRQGELFDSIGSLELYCLSTFIQDISVIRLENKNIWAGYETLFLDLFLEISKRIDLDITTLLFTHRIEDISTSLHKNVRLDTSLISSRKNYFNLEISPAKNIIRSAPYYTDHIADKIENKDRLQGEAGNLGKTIGRALIVTEDGIDSLLSLQKTIRSDDIYITTMTHPAMVSLLDRVKGVVTDEGGITSHAAIVSRELGIPCLVGTRCATRFFKTGEYIELDSTTGSVRRLSDEEIRLHKLGSNSSSESEGNTLEIVPQEIVLSARSISSIPYFVDLSTNTDVSSLGVGGKGESLSISSKLHPVPQAYGLTRRLFDEILSSYLSSQNASSLHLNIYETVSFSSDLASVRNFISTYEFNDEFMDEFTTILNSITSGIFAVRSSGSVEDSDSSSFAGQFSTFLGLNRGQVLTALRDCLSSAFIENVLVYLVRSGVSYDDFYMSVVIQDFVPSDKAGVFFTRHPHGNKDAFFIEANFGVGESVVSGEVTPDRYTITSQGIQTHVSEAKRAYDFKDGERTIYDVGNKQVLDDQEIRQLSNLAHVLLDAYAKPIEFEWCFKDDKLYLLQVRAITTGEEVVFSPKEISL